MELQNTTNKNTYQNSNSGGSMLDSLKNAMRPWPTQKITKYTIQQTRKPRASVRTYVFIYALYIATLAQQLYKECTHLYYFHAKGLDIIKPKPNSIRTWKIVESYQKTTLDRSKIRIRDNQLMALQVHIYMVALLYAIGSL